MKHNCCPKCKGVISWRQRWKFATGIGVRKPSPCPHCGTMLVWAKWPHRLIHVGVLFYFIFALLQLLRLLKVELRNASEIMIWIGILLLLVGVFTLRIEIADSDENKC
jgi:hypothetical protein